MMTAYITAYEENYRKWPENEAIYLPNGRPPQPAELEHDRRFVRETPIWRHKRTVA